MIPNCNFLIRRRRAEEWPKLVEFWEREIAPASRAVPSFRGAMFTDFLRAVYIFACVRSFVRSFVGWGGCAKDKILAISLLLI